MGERVMKSVFVTFVLVTLGLSVVLAVEPPCPRPPARCPRTWNYQNAQQWGSLCQDWSTCSSGQAQSPIDVFPPAAAISSNKRFDIKYQPQTNVFVFNTGKKFIFPVNQTNRSTFDYNGVTYFLRSVEFHAPSEHLLRGKRYNLEMQLTHKAGDGRLLIVSIFFDVGDCGAASNSFLEQIQYNLPQFSGAMCGNGRVENLAGYFSEECDNGVRNSNDSASPNCCRNDCTLARCGDGVKDTTEQCDNGRNNSNTPGACRTNCRLPACGDGILDPNEQCDDGNVLNGDGCTSICRNECGDGQLNFVEQCDNGTLNSDALPDSCRTNCRFASCGDSVVDSKEECDFGSLSHGNNPSQCRASCKAPRCGDGFTDLNEDCDDGDGNNGANGPCSANCTLNCGNGKIETGEECDDGAFNSNAPNGRCRTNCKLRSCGDGIIDTEYDEQCDSAFGVNNTWCSDKCIQRCGNGIIEAGEECDNGCTNSDTPDAPCRTNCKLPVCGDGIVDRGEDCDLGPLNSLAPNSACRPGCKAQRCGDGVADLEKGEECDNGRNNLGSGCNLCRSECGNGNLDAGEECDFGEKNSDSVPDGCRKSCKLARCGDGVLDSREECDAGSANSDSAPNACRTNCRFNYCGDGVIDPQNGEQCDNGAANSDTAVDGCSSDCILNQFRQSRVLGTRIVDLNKALPRSHSAVAYHGSLAAPPCTEGVQWLLFQEVQPITKFQYDLFTAAPYGIFNNTRPVQKVCTRTVTRPFDVPVPSCGNGIQEVGEQCDNGLRNSDDQANACRTNCRDATCGDGVTDSGEECDDVLATSRCTALCRFPKPLSNPFTCPVWSYKDACKWSLLCPQWNLCNSERANSQQSPINLDISPKLGRGKFNLDFSYSQTSITSVNSGRGVALLNSNANNVLRVPGDARLYSLKFIRFHSPSEHAINGQHADLEAQFHHVTADGAATAVVSVLFNKGPRNGFLDQFWFYLSRDSDCRFGNNVINPSLGEQCDNGWKNSDTRPDQCRSNGRLPSCGDGVVDRGEQCDDGANNQDAADSCKPDCRLPFCGDGFVDAGEACDPLYDSSCTLTCTKMCGNGIKEVGEDCDNGPENSDTPNACRTNCKSPICGDYIVDSTEECDSPFACHNCFNPTCGDGFIDDAEECDDGNFNGDTAACSRDCQLNCGNGRVDTLEQCDDGMNNSNSDGACRTDCSTPTCGDFITDKSRGEQCDDGPRGSIFCSTNCTILCGNGIVEDGEDCDDGAANSDTLPNACRTNCQNPFCGDGVRDKQEECDFGSQNGSPNSPCRLTCKLPRFGDHVVDAGEECDDGNLDNGDGCSSTGLWECGNGRRDGQEECDNGADNADKPNACRTRTWKYGGCVKPTCGDGIIDDGEQCDDGIDNNSDDLPNRCRTNCKLPTRGDGVVDDLYGERCDNGAHNHDFLDECSGSNILNECRTSTATAGQVVDLQNAFDRTSPVLTYKGSSSQPPCEEGWTYFVLSKISTVDQLQLDSLRKISPPGNVRGLQPLNGRVPVYTATQDAVCGDGVMEKDEECDAGDNNANQPNKCRTNCKKPSCGDGILDAGEQCDNGRLGNSAKGPCGTNCRWTGTPATAGCTQNGSNTCATSPTTTINVIFANLLKGAQCSTGSCPNQQ